MKQISTNLLAVLCVMLLLFTACKKNSDFTVEGVVSGADGQMMYLENVGVSTVELMDSVKLTAAGKFSFTKPRPAFPDFYRLRLNNQLINFSVDSTETISFVADAGTFATSYSVEGSENCKAIKNITLAQLDANQAIHRLRKESESGLLADSVYSRQVLEAAEAYKDVARKYIYSAPMSAAAYFAKLCRGKVSYKMFVIAICVFSAVVSNLGLDRIVAIAAPVLDIVYPPTLVLIFIALVRPQLPDRISRGAALGALLMSVLCTLDGYGVPLTFLHKLPLFDLGFAWVLPAVLFGAAAALLPVRRERTAKAKAERRACLDEN